MKKILNLLMYLTVGNLCCLGQGPSKFPLAGATWICSTGPAGPGPGVENTLGIKYRIPSFNYDTIISNNNYSKVYGGSPLGIYSAYMFAIRYDSISDKVFAVKSGETQERLIMDQSKLAGDTIFNMETFNPSTDEETTLDTVTVVSKVPFTGNYNGISYGTDFYVLRTIPYNGYYSYWLKNIGFRNFFLFWEGLLVSSQHFLECLFYNDTMYAFGSFSQSACLEEYATKVQETNKFSGPKNVIFTENEIFVNLFDKPRVDAIKIIDFNGREFYHKEGILNCPIVISKSFFSKGLYIIIIISDKSKEIIKFSIYE